VLIVELANADQFLLHQRYFLVLGLFLRRQAGDFLVQLRDPLAQLREVARLGDVKLIPGMPVEAFVQTGDRTMLSYLIKPLNDQLMRAFRER
jgi:hypothetical protein